MIAEPGPETGAAGGQTRRTVLSQWDTIAPELKGKVQAVRYDDATLTLHLRPCSPAYPTRLVLIRRRSSPASTQRPAWAPCPAWRSWGPAPLTTR